jgi:hypothetical protein
MVLSIDHSIKIKMEEELSKHEKDYIEFESLHLVKLRSRITRSYADLEMNDVTQASLALNE